jgi:hypothetical protein
MWVEEGEFDEADDLHLTSGQAVAAWAATSAGTVLRELEIADYWPQACWRKAEALPLISHYCMRAFLRRLPLLILKTIRVLLILLYARFPS